MIKRNAQINYLIEKVLNNPWSTVRIRSLTLGSEFSVKGLIQGGLSIAGNNEFETPISANLDDIAGVKELRAVTQVLGVQGPLNSMMGKSLLTTTKTYSNSSVPQIVVNMILVNIRKDQSVLDDVTKLHACVLPRSAGGLIMTSPLGYSGVDGADDFRIRAEGEDLESSVQTNLTGGDGTLVVAFSRYFYGVGLICRDMNYQLSEENSINGPLYATVSMTFEPKRMITITEFRNYFSRMLSPNFDNNKNFKQQTEDFLNIIPDAIIGVGQTVTQTVTSVFKENGNPKIISNGTNPYTTKTPIGE